MPTPYAVIPATAGIQYNMSGEIRLIIGLLDSRYDEKYSRYRSLFFYRSGMTALRQPLLSYTISTMDEKFPCIYIMTNKPNGTLYIGVTSDLLSRVWQHKNGEASGFSKRYKTKILVYYEPCGNMESAIEREKQLKKWNRKWKLELIETHNPDWRDLYEDLFP